MTALRKLPLLAGMVLTLAGASCSKDVSYAYVDVHVKIDPATVTPAQLASITSCEAQIVAENVNESVSLRCRENRVTYDVGTFEWSTDRTGGTLQVIVRVLAVNLVLVGEATSPPISVAAGKRSKIELLVNGVVPAAGTDAGSAASLDGGTTTPSDAGVEHASDAGGPTADAANNQLDASDAAAFDQATDAGPDSSDTSLDVVAVD